MTTVRALTLLVLALLAAAPAAALTCGPGFFLWIRDGIERCQLCAPGCACPGGLQPCRGCSGGAFSAAAGAAACLPCPPGTTSDAIFNDGCEPENYQTPCANRNGPLGQITCRPDPPPQNVTFVAPGGALYAPPQYLPGGPPYVPNKVPPYYDVDLKPMLQQSY